MAYQCEILAKWGQNEHLKNFQREREKRLHTKHCESVTSDVSK